MTLESMASDIQAGVDRQHQQLAASKAAAIEQLADTIIDALAGRLTELESKVASQAAAIDNLTAAIEQLSLVIVNQQAGGADA